MLTSKQRATLRGIASSYETILQVGKNGIGETLIQQVSDALRKRELIKLHVLENSELSAREAAEQLAEATESEVVQVIGSRFVLTQQVEAVYAARIGDAWNITLDEQSLRERFSLITAEWTMGDN